MRPGLAFAAMLALAGGAQGQTRIDVIPTPLAVTEASFAPVRLRSGDAIAYPARDAEARFAAQTLASLARRSGGLRLLLAAGGEGKVVFARDPSLKPEAYRLTTGPGRATIAAADAAGLYYGAATLWQLIGADGRLPGVAIDDRPRFSWRGLLIDSARHRQSLTELERMVDWMSLHKLNVLQWHLTDDQGWMIPLRGWPRLSTIAAWRTPAYVAGEPRPARIGGVYSEAEMRTLVAYARRRAVTIVPEIESPGHAAAALMAYPELSAGPPPPRHVQSDFGVFPYAFGVSDEDFRFLGDAFGEAMAIFPGTFVAVGGDEVVKAAWADQAAVQARMRALGLADDKALHAWFLGRIAGLLAAHGRRAIGWDDILEGGSLPAGTAVLSWRGGAGAQTALAAGHDVVLAVDPTLYFDHRQADDPGQPPGRGLVESLADVYAYEPPASPGPGHVLGVQGQLWTEYIATGARLETMAFPRAAALAEVAWSAAEQRDFPDFLRRLPAEIARYQALGLAESKSALAVQAKAEPAGEYGATVSLATQSPGLEVRYGAAGGPVSTPYQAPIKVSLPAHLEAAAFLDGRQVSETLHLSLDSRLVRRRTSPELDGCRPGGVTLDIEGGAGMAGRRPIYLVDIMQPCWLWPAADLDDVGRIEVAVGRLPFNFQIGDSIRKIILRPASTPAGELLVMADSCAAPPLVSIPLATAVGREPGEVSAALPKLSGRHDLCFSFTAHDLDPMWVLDWVQLAGGSA